jgi:hypothetical protein
LQVALCGSSTLVVPACAAAGYRSFNTHSKVPTTEAFASGPVLRQERKPSIADEVHAVAKVCFTVLTGEYASELNSADLRRQAMKPCWLCQ